VINYELPETSELFTHRVGRTGRIGQSGQAITLISAVDLPKMKEIERELGKRLPRVEAVSLSAPPVYRPKVVEAPAPAVFQTSVVEGEAPARKRRRRKRRPVGAGPALELAAT
jgi:superfamily II DNA/RNA helicase